MSDSEHEQGSFAEDIRHLKSLAKKPSSDKDKLLIELLDLIERMGCKIESLESDCEELQSFIENVDEDLSALEQTIYEDDEDEDDEDIDDEDDEDEELSFDCPNCGETVMIKASDIDEDENPICKHCGKPFFLESPDDTDDTPTKDN